MRLAFALLIVLVGAVLFAGKLTLSRGAREYALKRSHLVREQWRQQLINEINGNK